MTCRYWFRGSSKELGGSLVPFVVSSDLLGQRIDRRSPYVSRLILAIAKYSVIAQFRPLPEVDVLGITHVVVRLSFPMGRFGPTVNCKHYNTYLG